MTTCSAPASASEMFDRWRERKIAAYLAEHGSAPECGCGCGEPVNFDDSAKPYRYRFNHHVRVNGAGRRVTEARLKDNLDIADVRKAFRDIKERRNMTWNEMARTIGISLNHMTYFMYGSQRTVGREWTRNALLRLAGKATPPTVYERKDMLGRAAVDYRDRR